MKLVPGKRIVTGTAVLAALVLLSTGFLFRHRLAEEYWLRELRSQPVELRLLAAKRLGEIRSVRAVPALIREFRRIVGTTETAPLGEYAYQVFQGALVQIGTASLAELVRNVSTSDPIDASMYTFLQDTIQILYLDVPHRDPGYGESVSYELDVLQNAIQKMKDDPHGAAELREAAAYALEKNSRSNGGSFGNGEEEKAAADPVQEAATSP